MRALSLVDSKAYLKQLALHTSLTVHQHGVSLYGSISLYSPS